MYDTETRVALADKTLPTVTGIPPSGANAAISGNIAVTFSEAMNYAVNETTPAHNPEIYVTTNG